jgi:trans-2,3-dihydro-3-hydroxyanthranilate isomerase
MRSMPRPVAFLDVFSARPLAGNGLAVVDDADGLDDEVMLAFARETRLSETTFVQSPRAEGADYRNRIWTPGEELPFAGHPSLGTAVAVARWRGVTEASFVQETGAGLQPIEVRREGGEEERWRAAMLQSEAVFGAELDRERTLAAVGLQADDADPELTPQIASTGLTHAIVPVSSEAAIARARPDYPAIDALLTPHDAVVLYLAWCEPGAGRARARGFSRIVELGEDPATGSAAGPLCAYLAERTGARRVTISQGEEMGRPSTIDAELDGDRVQVSGYVVPLIAGSVELPA